ncbi:MAG: alkaline phosphatase D family protein [Phycisphaeraceae bacterium]
MPSSGSSGTGKPRYLTEIPWIGPLLVDAVDSQRNALVGIGAASNPSLGEALAAILVPVDANCTGSDPSGDPPWRVASLQSDGNGRFKIDAPAEFWKGKMAGLLMVLVYDHSGAAAARSFPDTWSPVSDLPPNVREEVQTRIHKLLEKGAKHLEPGLIEHKPPEPASDLTFALASCQYPAGFVDREIAEASYERLAAQKLNGLLLLGDQVYLDATAGLFDPTAQHDRFDLPYERLLRTQPLRKVLRRVPAYMMLDDHEIEDNWEPVAGGNGTERNVVEGRRSYLGYQRIAGPQQLYPAGDSRDTLWYIFQLGDLPFFMADTRTERRPRKAETIESACIMSESQFETLLEWLETQKRKNRDIPKFIASPASFLPRHRRATQHEQPASALRSDGWDGYPSTFYRLLTHIAAKDIRNVIFLSGDEHVSFAIKADITDKTSKKVTRIWSIHSSGLYSPFPFANAAKESLCWDEDFEFGDYRCKVVPLNVTPGDGFALLRARGEDSGWSVRCCFDRAPGAKAGGKWFDVV